MNIYGTPPAVISLREAAEGAEMSEDDFLEALAAKGLQPVIVSGQKLGVRPADLEAVKEGASEGLHVYEAPNFDQQARDDWPWQENYVPTLGITGEPVLTGQVGVAYDGFTVEATGGDQPYTYSLVGTWPAGITIDPDTGEVSGTPTEDGSFGDLSVRVTDDRGSTAELDEFTLVISEA